MLTRGCRTFKLSSRVHTSEDDSNTVRTEWPECLESVPILEVGSDSNVEVMEVGID